MKNNHIEKLIPSWFEGTLSPEEREKVEQWKAASEENRQIFADSLRAWEGMEQLRRMKKYNPEKAIQQVNAKIEKQKRIRVLDIFQKVAAVLILPLIVATLWFALEKPAEKKEPFVPWHTLEIPAGMRSEFYLPDSTKVYLNSKTSLSYPLFFNDTLREVKLSGEAYFEVAENKDVPFIVNTGRINIEVTGTEFIATRYPHEELTEIVLVKGGINLFQGDYLTTKKDIIQLKPGEKALCLDSDSRLAIDKVNTEKYSAWKNGVLLFRDDPMPEVVRRLNRWFNVDIQLEGPELKGWAYTATFEDESLEQVLELLKISAPVDYMIKRREMKTDKTFSKMEIVIKQKR
jgi:ferric-dicitrate binding protein FerR (iron transport regulator)